MDLIPVVQAQRLEKPTSLDQLADRARKLAERCEDYTEVRLAHTFICLNGTWTFSNNEGKLSRHALNQICGRIRLPGGGSVPAGYLARCPTPLAASNLNHWIRQAANPDDRVLVRTVTPNGQKRCQVRAVLSDRYAVVNHEYLLHALRDAVPQFDLGVQSWSLDDEQLTLRLVADRDHPASLDDPIRVGVHVSNSEIGLGSISIRAFLMRLVCTNGMVVRVADLGGLHRRHVGRAGENLEEAVHNVLPDILAQGEEAARRFLGLKEEPAPNPLDEYLKRTAAHLELPESALKRVEEVIEGETMYDVVNAFTRTAQGYAVAERIRIETLVSQFLSDRHNWN